METILLLIGTAIICLLIVVIVLLVSVRNTGSADHQTDSEVRLLIEQFDKNSSSANRQLREELNSNVQTTVKNLGEMLSAVQKNFGETQSEKINEMNAQIFRRLSDMDKFLSEKQTASGEAVNQQLKVLENRFKSLEAGNEQRLDSIRKVISGSLADIQEQNSKKLDAIQSTVNEKLESKMTESFKLVSDRLEQVYKGLGEMQTIAAGVGDLKKVLSNVKNRGILGEIQLGAILEDILAPEQYDRDVATIPSSANRVEFAVKLPGSVYSGSIFLPIDSKFPGDTFAALQDAYDSGDSEKVAEAKKVLCTAIKKEAKDISEKYISPPYTTNFGIMFLPFEGLYAEAVNLGMVETLQRDYSISIAGPSTMAAILSSLQMGFQTLQIQKRSNEVWQLLASVKQEFEGFEKVLTSAQTRIRQLDDEMDKLVGARTKAIRKSLENVDISHISDGQNG